MFITLLLGLTADTIRITPADRAPTFDGRADSIEYGRPSLTIARPGGTVQLWLRRWQGSIYLAARIPDSTYYWGDDLVISLDTQGDRAPGPVHDDFRWYFRRLLDSSVVYRGDAGQWRMPRDDPDWRLGRAREGGGWQVRADDQESGWSLELVLDSAYLAEAAPGRAPGLAFRVYDNDPHGWHPWPNPPQIKQPTEVERRPELWAVVVTGP